MTGIRTEFSPHFLPLASTFPFSLFAFLFPNQANKKTYPRGSSLLLPCHPDLFADADPSKETTRCLGRIRRVSFVVSGLLVGQDPRTKKDILFSSSFIVRNSFHSILLHNFELFSSPSREFLFSSLKILTSVSFYIKRFQHYNI